ncbi:hypothetical protein AX14_004823 [Amanita brunnescens Koide BX004]|nr:hypothetical protein AX14_004823 [Amanita brunnescens Koide BX004]
MRQREWEALLLVLTTTDSAPVRDAVLTAPTNVETMMSRGRDEMLRHFGQVLTAEELNQLQHALNGNISGRELKKLMRAPSKKPYDRPEKSIKQESVSSDLLIPKFPICKGPAQKLLNYHFQQKLERVPEETLMEQQTRVQNWLWMVRAHRQKIERKSSRKYIPTLSLEQQPGFCYLHLFCREIRELINWPRYPTLHEVCSWDPELRNEEVKFEFTREGVRLYHLQRMSLSRYANDPVGATWTTNAARWLIQAIVGYQHAFGPTAPQPMELPPVAPEGSTAAQIATAENARDAARLHNATVDNDRITAATAIGTTIGEIARVVRPPPRPTKPTIKMDMPDPYEGDPAEISNWIRSMEVYFQVVDMDDMGNMILMMLQRIRKGKGNRAGTYSAVKLKEWIDAEREFIRRVGDGTMTRVATYEE